MKKYLSRFLRRSFWNLHSLSWDEYLLATGYRQEIEAVADHIGRLQKNSVRSVLDMGCGTGNFSLALCRRGFSVTGVDSASLMLFKARRKAGKENLRANFILGDYQRTIKSFPARNFSTVIAMHSLSASVCNSSLYLHIKNVLTPDGRLYVLLKDDGLTSYDSALYIPDQPNQGNFSPLLRFTRLMARHFFRPHMNSSSELVRGLQMNGFSIGEKLRVGKNLLFCCTLS